MRLSNPLNENNTMHTTQEHSPDHPLVATHLLSINKSAHAAQIQAMNEAQTHTHVLGPFGHQHPMTCRHRNTKTHGDAGGDLGLLIATPEGLFCPYCGYTQEVDWDADALSDVSSPAHLSQSFVDIELEKGALVGKIDRYIAEYTALQKNHTYTLSDSSERIEHVGKVWHATAIMIMCLERRKLALQGIETRPGRLQGINSTWIDAEERYPEPNQLIEVLWYKESFGLIPKPDKIWCEKLTTKPQADTYGIDGLVLGRMIHGGKATHWRPVVAINQNPTTVLSVISQLPDTNIAAASRLAVQEELMQNGKWLTLSAREKELVLLGASLGVMATWGQATNARISALEAEVKRLVEALDEAEDEIDLKRLAIKSSMGITEPPSLAEDEARTKAYSIYEKAFSVPRDPRSAEYRHGVLNVLKFRLGEANEIAGKRLFEPGTAQFDAYFAGCNEGHRLARKHAHP